MRLALCLVKSDIPHTLLAYFVYDYIDIYYIGPDKPAFDVDYYINADGSDTELTSMLSYSMTQLYDVCIKINGNVTLSQNYKHINVTRIDEVVTLPIVTIPEHPLGPLVNETDFRFFYTSGLAFRHIANLHDYDLCNWAPDRYYSYYLTSTHHQFYFLIKRYGYHNVSNKGITIDENSNML